MSFDDGFNQAEPEAEAALGTAFVASIQASPDLILLGFRNAVTVVAKFGDSKSWLSTDTDAHTATFGCVLNRIVEKVGEHLADSGAVSRSDDNGWWMVGS